MTARRHVFEATCAYHELHVSCAYHELNVSCAYHELNVYTETTRRFVYITNMMIHRNSTLTYVRGQEHMLINNRTFMCSLHITNSMRRELNIT